jgi:hypothetical protein
VGNLTQFDRIGGAAAVHKDKTYSAEEQEPAEAIRGNDLELSMSPATLGGHE